MTHTSISQRNVEDRLCQVPYCTRLHAPRQHDEGVAHEGAWRDLRFLDLENKHGDIGVAVTAWEDDTSHLWPPYVSVSIDGGRGSVMLLPLSPEGATQLADALLAAAQEAVANGAVA